MRTWNRRRWHSEAQLFCEMLADMRFDFSGGNPLANHLKELLDGAPSGPAYHNMDFYSFAKLMRELSMDMAETRCNKTSWGVAATDLFVDIEEALMEHCLGLAPSAKASLASPLAVRPVADDSGEILTDLGRVEDNEQIAVQRAYHLLLVNLPLGVYVRNSPHLYEMLSRLRRLWERRPVESVKQMRGILDEEGHHYSVLVYATFAALQVLFQVAGAHGGAWRLSKLWPLNGSSSDSSRLACKWDVFFHAFCISCVPNYSLGDLGHVGSFCW